MDNENRFIFNFYSTKDVSPAALRRASFVIINVPFLAVCESNVYLLKNAINEASRLASPGATLLLQGDVPVRKCREYLERASALKKFKAGVILPTTKDVPICAGFDDLAEGSTERTRDYIQSIGESALHAASPEEAELTKAAWEAGDLLTFALNLSMNHVYGHKSFPGTERWLRDDDAWRSASLKRLIPEVPLLTVALEEIGYLQAHDTCNQPLEKPESDEDLSKIGQTERLIGFAASLGIRRACNEAGVNPDRVIHSEYSLETCRGIQWEPCMRAFPDVPLLKAAIITLESHFEEEFQAVSTSD